MIGGQECYEIVEAFHHRGKVEYRSFVPLGTNPDPKESLRKNQESLIDVTRALIRLQPLQDAIPRKCDTLASRLKDEQERIGLLIDAIERLDDANVGGDAAQPENEETPEAEKP